MPYLSLKIRDEKKSTNLTLSVGWNFLHLNYELILKSDSTIQNGYLILASEFQPLNLAATLTGNAGNWKLSSYLTILLENR